MLEDVAVCVPEDFSAASWRRLPFQLGEPTGTASFRVPREREADLRRAAGGRGAFSEREGALFWEVDPSDMAAAASWAVAHGIEPVAPVELVRAARELLEGVVAHAS